MTSKVSCGAFVKHKSQIVQRAITRYIEVFGDSVQQPCKDTANVARNGSVFLRNVNGPLAFVTSTGKVFDRIGGSHIEGGGEK